MSAGVDRSALGLRDAVVLVTGGTKGTGRGIVDRFVEAGSTVVTCARNEPEAALPDGVEFEPCDVRDPEAGHALIDGIAGRHGRLDVLVNNAGGSPPAGAAEASPRFSEAIIRLNLIGPLHLCRAAHDVMVGQDDGGVIVNVGSVVGGRAAPTTSAYGAAKAGLLNLTRTLAMEWAPDIRVNAVSPGSILTEQAELFYRDDEGIARVAATIPMGRLATPHDVGDACLYLASPLSAYVSGANIELHGGGEPPPFLGAVAET